jgi:DNA-binding NtrC family response regulator
MSLSTHRHESNVALKSFGRLAPKNSAEARLLIVCDDNTLSERLRTMFAQAGFISEAARGITEACDAAKSGRFQVVVTLPLMRDGSWRRLVDVTKHYDLGLEVILLVRDFDLGQWADALNDGAFDILHVSSDLPDAAEIATSAFWAVYLRGAGPLPRCLLKSDSSKHAA